MSAHEVASENRSTAMRMVYALRRLMSQDRLQVAFLLLINISVVSIFILYAWTVEPNPSMDWSSKPPYHDRKARWETLLLQFESECGHKEDKAPPPGPQPRPQPTSNILFIKTHKTGSSTVSNILLRHALAQDWAICLPVIDDAHMGWPRAPTGLDLYVSRSRPSCNLIAHHAVYHPNGFLSQFFSQNTKLVKIAFIRDPLQIVESSLYYLQEVEKLRLPVVGRLEAFLNDPSKHNTYFSFPNGGKFSLGHNFLSRELGYDESHFKKTSEFIEFVEANFDLIGVTENFTESLVLMRRLTGLPLIALTFTHLNENMSRERARPQFLRERLKSISPVDYDLYNHFTKKFAKQLKYQSQDFHQEVKCVKVLNKLIRKFCTHGAMHDVLRLSATPWSKKVSFLQTECLNILKLPRQISPMVREAQFSYSDYIIYFLRRFLLKLVR